MRGSLLLVAVALTAACGGSVVVDGSPGDGGGGSGSSSSSSSDGCFFTPAPVGGIDPATCSGTSNGTSCSKSCVDGDGHAYAVECTLDTCQCMRDGVTVCTCAAEGGATFCSGEATPCCPSPWID